ncbi:MAG: DeoR family transcriptional regulator [bacterium]|nr:DeoR family transcriptional regulator [bacterium]
MEDKFVKITNAVYKILEFFPETEPLKNRAKEKALSIMENLTLSANRRINKDDWITFKDCLPENMEKASDELLKDIEILLSFLKLGKFQGWINDANFLIIYNEYEKIKEGIPQSLPAYKLPQKEAPREENVNDKKDLLYENLKEEKPNVSNFSPLAKSEGPKVLSQSEGLKQDLFFINLNEEKGINPDIPEKFISERQNKILKFLKENKKAQVMDLKTVLDDVTKRTIRRDLDDLLKKGSIVRVGEWNQVFYQIPNHNLSI